jgi:hypothetical protein
VGEPEEQVGPGGRGQWSIISAAAERPSNGPGAGLPLSPASASAPFGGDRTGHRAGRGTRGAATFAVPGLKRRSPQHPGATSARRNHGCHDNGLQPMLSRRTSSSCTVRLHRRHQNRGPSGDTREAPELSRSIAIHGKLLRSILRDTSGVELAAMRHEYPHWLRLLGFYRE